MRSFAALSEYCALTLAAKNAEIHSLKQRLYAAEQRANAAEGLLRLIGNDALQREQELETQLLDPTKHNGLLLRRTLSSAFGRGFSDRVLYSKERPSAAECEVANAVLVNQCQRATLLARSTRQSVLQIARCTAHAEAELDAARTVATGARIEALEQLQQNRAELVVADSTWTTQMPGVELMCCKFQETGANAACRLRRRGAVLAAINFDAKLSAEALQAAAFNAKQQLQLLQRSPPPAKMIQEMITTESNVGAVPGLLGVLVETGQLTTAAQVH